MKNTYLIFLIMLCMSINAQVGIGTTSSANASLEIAGKASDASSPDGVLVPRLSGEQLKTKTYTNAQLGAVVYVTSPVVVSTAQTARVTKTGFYYFDGTRWIPFPQVYYGSVNIGDLIIGGPDTNLTSTGFVATATGLATKSTVTGGWDILVTHNLGLSGLQRVTCSFKSNVVNDFVQLANDNDLFIPIVHDVTANSFRVYISETANSVQNITMMMKLVN